MENRTTGKKKRTFLYCVKKALFGELFSEICFKSSSELTLFENLGKFEMPLNQSKWLVEFMQNSTFSTGQHRKGTYLKFLFAQFVI